MSCCCFTLKLIEARSTLSIELKEYYLTLGNLVDIFEALNVLNLILPGKNINHINDYNANNAFVVNVRLGIVEFKKKIQLPFLN